MFTMRIAVLLAVLCRSSLLAAQQPSAPTNDRYTAAQSAYDDSNYELAASEFEQANVALGGHCSACLAMAARAYGRAAHRESAIAESARAVEVANTPTERSNAHLQRGSVFLESRESAADLRTAEAEARSALAEDSHNLAARVLLGLALLRQGLTNDGIHELQSIANSPDVDEATRNTVRQWIDNPKRQRLEFAPDFRATTITGATFSLASLKGKVVLLDFWATWCVPCRAGLPDIKQLSERYKDRLVVVSISVDENDQNWRSFVAENAMNWPQLHDADGSLRTLFDSKVCPTYLLLDRTGVVRLRVNGMDPENSIASQLRPALETLLH